MLTGVARPLREPGISVLAPVPPDPTTGTADCCIPRFDENPERLLIDSEGLAGAPFLAVTSNVAITNVIGPLDFSFGAYKVLPQVPPTVGSNMSGVAVPDPAADEFTVAGFNIENFAGNDTRRRKAALAIRQLMRSPDVIGHIEILDLATLQGLADQVNADTVAAGASDPGYQAVLIPTPAGGTQNVGFLVKTSRVRIDSVSQERASETFINPNNGQSELLHDRPPLVLRATVDPTGTNPRAVIVVVNHLRSFIDIELVGGDGPRVRAKRKAQAESVAGLLQELQTLDPDTPVIAVGDYNAYQFNDGYTDPIATLMGAPTPDDQVVVDDSPDLVNPNFANLVDTLPPSERYSFIFEGTPQVLDHVLVNTIAAGYAQRLAIARGNADFPAQPESLFAGDATRPERSSDHDMPVAYFRFPPPSVDLHIAMTALPSTVAAGTQVSYTITVTNAGEAPAAQVVVTDQLPSSLSLVSCQVEGQRLRRFIEYSNGNVRVARAGSVRCGHDCRVCRMWCRRSVVDRKQRDGRGGHGGSRRNQQRRLGNRSRIQPGTDDQRRGGQPHAVAAAAAPDGARHDRLCGERHVRCRDIDAECYERRACHGSHSAARARGIDVAGLAGRRHAHGPAACRAVGPWGWPCLHHSRHGSRRSWRPRHTGRHCRRAAIHPGVARLAPGNVMRHTIPGRGIPPRGVAPR